MPRPLRLMLRDVVPQWVREIMTERIEQATLYGRLSLTIKEWGDLLLALFPEDFAEPATPLELLPPAEPALDDVMKGRRGRAAEPMRCTANTRDLED